VSISTLIRPDEQVIPDDAVSFLEDAEWHDPDWRDAVAEALNKACTPIPCPDWMEAGQPPKLLGDPDVAMEDVVALARKAAHVVEQRGWTTGSLVDSYDRVCAMGAVNIAAYGTPGPPPWSLDVTEAEIMQHGIRKACELMLYRWLGGIPVEHWNDGAVGMFHDETRHPFRSPNGAADVALMLRAFANDVEAGKVTL
jgi:hypothetical protein